MNERNLSLLKLHIGRFAGLSDLTLELRPERSNLVIAANRAGKTSVCEFLRFMFYGIDDSRRDYFPWEGERTVSGSLSLESDGRRYDISRMQSGEGRGHVSVVETQTNREVVLDQSPGEYFLGIDSWLYDRTIYFAQKQNAKVQDDLSVEALDRFAALLSGQTGLYSQLEEIQKEKNLLMNREKTGEIDRLMVRRKEYEQRMAELEARRVDLADTEKELADCETKMAERNRRIVLIKAELKNRGDLAASDDRANLRAEIDANEEKLRSIAENAHIGAILPNRVAAEELRMQYSEYCRLNARLTEAREKLMLSEDNLKFHGNLFTGGGTSTETVEDAKQHVDRARRMRVLLLSFSIFFLVAGLASFLVLYFTDTLEPLQAGIVGLSLLIFAAILGIGASIFRMRFERILEGFEIVSLDDFYELHEQFLAHKRTDVLYQEQAAKERAVIRDLNEKVAATLKGLCRFAPGQTSAQGVCDSCVHLLEAYAMFCEVGERIKDLRIKYEETREQDDAKTLDPGAAELQALSREVAELTRENEELFSQKTALEEHLADVRAEGNPAKELSELVSQNERGLLNLLERYRTLELSLELARDALSRFEKSVKSPIAEEINSMLSFALSAGESFEFGDGFELRYKRGDRRFALSGAGGGLSEMANIALRLSLAHRAVPKGLPLMFDESFSFIDEKSKRRLALLLKRDYAQILIFASGSDVVSAFSDGAVIQTFGAAL